MSNGKPAHIALRGSDLKSVDIPSDGAMPAAVERQLDDYEFNTAGERDAARALLRHWEHAHGNLSEIARRSEWSPPHIRRVYTEFFEPAGDGEQMSVQSADELSKNELSDQALEIYRKGYRDGFADGVEHGREPESDT